MNDIIADATELLTAAGYNRRDIARHVAALEKVDHATASASLVEYRECYGRLVESSGNSCRLNEEVFPVDVPRWVSMLANEVRELRAEVVRLKNDTVSHLHIPQFASFDREWFRRQALEEGSLAVA